MRREGICITTQLLQLIRFMHYDRPGESQEAMDGKKKTIRDIYPKTLLKNDPLHAAAIRQVVSCQLLLVRLFIILRRLSFEGCGVFVSVEVFQFNGTTSQASGF